MDQLSNFLSDFAVNLIFFSAAPLVIWYYVFWHNPVIEIQFGASYVFFLQIVVYCYGSIF